MCDQERYLELHTDVQEQALYEEEEWKRYYQSLSEGFNAVGFVYEQQYDPSLPTDDDQELTAALEAAVEKFVAPSELLVPPEMNIPASNKINAIIEKTANFVVLHGGQMEIMIKTKQANNPLFEFLNIDNKLCPYYKHMIKMIKNGKYKPKVENDSEGNDDDDNDDDEDNDGGYLHPILTVKSQPAECRKPVKLPVVDVQNTSYGDLIRSVRASTARQNANKLKAKEESESKSNPKPPFMAQPVYGPNVPPPPGVEPVTLPQSHQPPPPGTDNAIPLCLPKYDSCDSPENTAGSDSGCRSDIIPPAPDVQPVIDKMALYVAKNGIEFEMVVKNKCDPRFEFLNKDHLHHPYYKFKKQLHLKEFEKERKKMEEQKCAQNKGVSFSIKTKTKEQESVPLEKRPVFACESSEDETEGDVPKQSRSNSPDTDRGEVQLSKKSTETKIISDDKLEKTDSPSQEDTDRKLAEEKLKDRLALAAREKLAQATKEKQLQAERKRKAALFINMLKSSNQLVPQGNNSENPEVGDHCEMSLSGNTPIPSQTNSPQLDNNYECTNSSDYPMESTSKKEMAKSASEKGNEKNDQSGSHSKIHHRLSRSPTPPCAYHLSRRYNSTVVLPHSNEKSPSQTREKRSRSPHNKKVKSPSRKRSSSKSPSRKGKSSATKSPSPSKRKHQSQSRSQSRSPSRYAPSGRQSRRRDYSPNYTSSHNRSSKLRHRSRSRSPSHLSRSQYTSSSSSAIGGQQSHRREKSRSRSQSRTHRDRSKSPHIKKNSKSPSRKRSHSKSPLRKLKSYSKSPNSKKKHKRSRSRSQSKKRSKFSRLESEKSSSKSTSKSKSRKDSKDKKSHLPGKKENSLKKKNDVIEKKDLSKNGGLAIDLTTKPDSFIELSSEAENDVNTSIVPNNQQSEETIGTKVESQVSETILSKVRAMLKASRQAILTEKDCPDI